MLSLDWNRMLHKKKKNAPFQEREECSAVPKRDVRVEKMTKSKIGDEKKCIGGFLNRNKYDELNSGMQHPGLVARLMGLESMPIVNHKKPEAPSSSLQFNSNRSEASEDKESSRPQKLRRMGGFSESPPAETRQFNRRVIRRHHGHKISSPAKSPWLLPKKNTFRVIGQSRSSTYVGSAQYNDEESKDVRKKRFYELPVLRIQDKENSMEGHRNVGNSLDGRKNYMSKSPLKGRSIPCNNGVSSFSRSRGKESDRRRVESERNGLERRNMARKRRPDNSSPMKRDCTNEDVVENRRSKAKPCYRASRLKNSVSDEKIETVTSRVVNSRGDALQAVSEQKQEDLNSLGQDEATEPDGISGRYTTSILEEIISALGRRQEDGAFSNFKSTQGVMVKADGNLQDPQAEVEAGTSAALSVSDDDYPSPFSILEVSFSNNSCSGCKPDIDSTESCKNIHLSYLDADLRDSASSMSKGKVENSTSEGSSVVSYDREAMANAELLLDNISGRKSSLHDIMEEAIAEGMSVRESVEVHQFEKLLFDCSIESVGSKYNVLFESGSDLALWVRREELTTQIREEIRGWKDMAGKAMSDLVEMDLSGSRQLWTDFVGEECQSSMEIEDEILHRLVEELVIDISN